MNTTSLYQFLPPTSLNISPPEEIIDVMATSQNWTLSLGEATHDPVLERFARKRITEQLGPSYKIQLEAYLIFDYTLPSALLDF